MTQSIAGYWCIFAFALFMMGPRHFLDDQDRKGGRLMDMMFAVIAVGVAAGSSRHVRRHGRREEQGTFGATAWSTFRRVHDQLDAGFSERAIAPALEKVGGLVLRFTPQGWVGRAQKKLVLAGWADRMDGNTWAAIRIIVVVVVFVLWIVVQSVLDTTNYKLLALAVMLAMGFFGPEAVLNREDR